MIANPPLGWPWGTIRSVMTTKRPTTPEYGSPLGTLNLIIGHNLAASLWLQPIGTLDSHIATHSQNALPSRRAATDFTDFTISRHTLCLRFARPPSYRKPGRVREYVHVSPAFAGFGVLHPLVSPAAATVS